MAVDWVAHNVYWTNAEARRIEVARLDGSSRRTLVWKDLDTPTTIVVDPGRGLVFSNISIIRKIRKKSYKAYY